MVLTSTMAAAPLTTPTAVVDALDALHREAVDALGGALIRFLRDGTPPTAEERAAGAFCYPEVRVTYAPELRSGMAKHEVAALLPRILARVNPAGARLAPRNLPPTSSDWVRAIEGALGVNTPARVRLSEASRAVTIAQRDGMIDHRLGFAYYARARVSAAAVSYTH